MKRRIALVLALLVPNLHGAAQAESARIIYRCETPQGPVFSDRPCGATSQPYKPDAQRVSVVETVVPSVAPRPVRAAVRPPQPAALKSSQPEECERLRLSLQKIVSTMRTGYDAKQGARLTERKRELEQKRRTLKC